MPRLNSIGFLSLSVMLFAAPAAAQDEVVWDVDAARTTGNGCSAEDTFFIAAGRDVSIIFIGMGANLDSPAAPNAQNRHCKLSIPVWSEKSVFIDEIRQTLHYAWSKDAGTSGHIEGQARMFRQWLTPLRVDLAPEQSGVMSWAMLEGTDHPRPPRSMCKRRAQKNLFELRLEVGAKRRRSSDAISLQLFGEDVRYELETDWTYCNASASIAIPASAVAA